MHHPLYAMQAAANGKTLLWWEGFLVGKMRGGVGRKNEGRNWQIKTKHHTCTHIQHTHNTPLLYFPSLPQYTTRTIAVFPLPITQVQVHGGPLVTDA